MSFFSKVLNNFSWATDKFYRGTPDPTPNAAGPVAGVERVTGKNGGISLKHQFKGEGSDQTPIINPTKKVKEWGPRHG